MDFSRLFEGRKKTIYAVFTNFRHREDVIDSVDAEDDAPAPADEHVCTDLGELVRRVQPHPSPYLPVHCNEHCLRLTLDTGAEVNLIRAPVAAYVGASVVKSTQTAYQADGLSPLTVVGETTLSLTRGAHTLTLQALVVDNIDVDVLAGTPFMSLNDVSVRPAEGTVSIGDDIVFCYVTAPHRGPGPTARRAQCLVRSPPETVTVWPDEYVELDVPDAEPDSTVSVEPWQPSCLGDSYAHLWPRPTVTSVVDGKIRVLNATSSPLRLKKNSHICKVYSVSTPSPLPETPHPSPPAPPQGLGAELVSIDPHGLLSDSMRSELASVIADFAPRSSLGITAPSVRFTGRSTSDQWSLLSASAASLSIIASVCPSCSPSSMSLSRSAFFRGPRTLISTLSTSIPPFS